MPAEHARTSKFSALITGPGCAPPCRTIFFCIALQYQNECRIEQNVWKTNKVKDIANVGLSVETAKVVLSNCSCQQLIISFKLSNVANLRIIYIYIYGTFLSG